MTIILTEMWLFSSPPTPEHSSDTPSEKSITKLKCLKKTASKLSEQERKLVLKKHSSNKSSVGPSKKGKCHFILSFVALPIYKFVNNNNKIFWFALQYLRRNLPQKILRWLKEDVSLELHSWILWCHRNQVVYSLVYRAPNEKIPGCNFYGCSACVARLEFGCNV